MASIFMAVVKVIDLLSFILKFGGSFCPFTWCVIINIVTNLANDLLIIKNWDLEEQN